MNRPGSDSWMMFAPVAIKIWQIAAAEMQESGFNPELLYIVGHVDIERYKDLPGFAEAKTAQGICIRNMTTLIRENKTIDRPGITVEDIKNIFLLYRAGEPDPRLMHPIKDRLWSKIRPEIETFGLEMDGLEFQFQTLHGDSTVYLTYFASVKPMWSASDYFMEENSFTTVLSSLIKANYIKLIDRQLRMKDKHFQTNTMIASHMKAAAQVPTQTSIIETLNLMGCPKLTD